MKQINIQINPHLEFMNSILLTSKYNEMTKDYIGYGLMTEQVNEYTEAIKDFFERYNSHPIYQFVEEMIPNGFTFSRPVEVALSLGNSKDFTRQYMQSEMCLKYCGGLDKVDDLLEQLKAFEKETDYFAFFEKQKCFYAPYLEKTKNMIQKLPYISILEQEFGKEQGDYCYVISSLMKGNYGVSFKNQSFGKTDMYSVFSTEGYSISEAILFHEYSHPFINPLTEKYRDLVNRYQDAYERLKPYRKEGFISGYGDIEECVNEHLVRAMVLHLLKKNGLFEEAEQMMNYDMELGYRYLPMILEQYEYYDKHRDIYRDFEAFYPTLIKVFSQEI